MDDFQTFVNANVAVDSDLDRVRLCTNRQVRFHEKCGLNRWCWPEGYTQTFASHVSRGAGGVVFAVRAWNDTTTYIMPCACFCCVRFVVRPLCVYGGEMAKVQHV